MLCSNQIISHLQFVLQLIDLPVEKTFTSLMGQKYTQSQVGGTPATLGRLWNKPYAALMKVQIGAARQDMAQKICVRMHKNRILKCWWLDDCEETQIQEIETHVSNWFVGPEITTATSHQQSSLMWAENVGQSSAQWPQYDKRCQWFFWAIQLYITVIITIYR